MRISDWSSDVCSSDLHVVHVAEQGAAAGAHDALVDDVGGQFRRGVPEGDLHGIHDGADLRSEAPRVGKASVSMSRSRGSRYHSKKNSIHSTSRHYITHTLTP